QQGEIERAAYTTAQAIDGGEQVVVGVNRFVQPGDDPVLAGLPLDPELQRQQAARVASVRAERDQTVTAAALGAVEATARGDGNLLPAMKEALRAGATLGEVSDALRGVFGEHDRR